MKKRMGYIKHDRNAIFEFIVSYKQDNDGNSPTFREIGKAFDIVSTSLIKYILRDLEDAGKIAIGRDRSRSIRVFGGRWSYNDRGVEHD